MPPPAFEFPRPRRWNPTTATAVLGAHVALALLAWQVKLVLPRSTGAPLVTILRLLPERTEPKPRTTAHRAAAPSPRQRPADAAPRHPVHVPHKHGAQAPVEPAAGAPPPAPLGAPNHTPGRVGLDGSDPLPSGPGASGPPGLVLTPSRDVLRGALANPATSDPRSNTPVATFEERIAMAMNPELCIKLERLPDGTVRRSMGRRVELPSTMQATHGHKTAPVRVCE